MSVNIKVTGGLNIEWGQIDLKVTGGLSVMKQGWAVVDITVIIYWSEPCSNRKIANI